MLHHIGIFPSHAERFVPDFRELFSKRKGSSQETASIDPKAVVPESLRQELVALTADRCRLSLAEAENAWNIRAATLSWTGDVRWLHCRLTYQTAMALLPDLLSLVWKRGFLPAYWNASMNAPQLWPAPHDSASGPQRLRDRSRSLREALLAQLPSCRHIRTVEDNGRDTRGYVIVLQRRRTAPSPSLADQVLRVRDILASSLAEGERLNCRHRAFWVESPGCTISFTIEAYNKHPTLSAHMDGEEDFPGRYRNGEKPVIEPLGRMSASLAFRQLRELADGRDYRQTAIWRRMRLWNMRRRYPNPADRLVASIKLEKRLRRINLYIGYDAPKYTRGSSLELQTVYSITHSEYDQTEADCLYIGEDEFSFIAPCIYPHVGEDFEYYSFLNVVGHATWKKIVQSLHRIAAITLHAPFSPEWKEHYRGCCEYLLEKDTFSLTDEERERLYYKHRHRLYDFYQFIIEWLEAHDLNDTGHAAINISGM